MRAAAVMLAAVLMVVSMPRPSGPSPSSVQSDIDDDRRVLLSLAVARFNGLTRDQAVLMLGIYRHELADPDRMVTCAYFGIRRSMMPIIAECRTDDMLFVVCAEICAQIVRRRCRVVSKASLIALNHGYGKGPSRYKGYAEDPDWWKGVRRRMKEFENILY